MSIDLAGISSMATRQCLADLVADWNRIGGSASFEALGGVLALEKVANGERVDVVILAADAIDRLIAMDRIEASSRVELMLSPVAIAVRKGLAVPVIDTEEALRELLRTSRAIGYSTGPSGVALNALFRRWGLTGQLGSRLVQAPPGQPVATLISRGDVDLGFQQLSELINVEGIEVVGPMPPGLEIVTTFAAGVSSTSLHPDVARSFIEYVRSPMALAAIRRHGMEPVSPAVARSQS